MAAHEDCKFCSEHSGMKVVIYVILAGVIANLAMLSYNTFGVTATVRNDVTKAVAELTGEVNLLKASDVTSVLDRTELKARVARLENKN